MTGNNKFLYNILNLITAHKNIATSLVELREQEQYMEHINDEENIVVQQINSFIEKLNNVHIDNNEIIDKISKCIYNSCKHTWMTDSIDISLDKHSIIVYCSLCGHTKQ